MGGGRKPVVFDSSRKGVVKALDTEQVDGSLSSAGVVFIKFDDSRVQGYAKRALVFEQAILACAKQAKGVAVDASLSKHLFQTLQARMHVARVKGAFFVASVGGKRVTGPLRFERKNLKKIRSLCRALLRKKGTHKYRNILLAFGLLLLFGAIFFLVKR